MRVSSAAFQWFLLGCVTSKSAEAFTRPSTFRPPNSNKRHHRNKASKVVLRQQQKEKSFLDYFKFNSDPKLRKSLGIQEDNGGGVVPHPPSEPPPAPLYFSEDTGKPLPNWTPPPVPDLSIPYDAAAKLAYEASGKTTTSYAKFQKQFEADAVADVMRKNGQSEEAIKAKMEELNQPAKSFLASSQATKVVVDTFVSPLIGTEIEKGVPIEKIQGACLVAAVLSLMYTSDLTISALAVVLTAFIAITPGPLGDAARFVGSVINVTGENLIEFSDKVGLADTLGQKLAELPEKLLSVDFEESIRNILKEAEDAITSVESQVDLSIPYDAAARLAYDASDKTMQYETFKAQFEADAIADVINKKQKELAEQSALEEKKKQEKEKERAEEARLAAIEEEKRQAEEAEKERLVQLAAEEQRKEEEDRLAEEARKVEEQRMLEEERLIEEARKAEEERLAAEDAQLAEEARKAEEERIVAEEARLAEEQRLAGEEEAARQAALDPETDDGDGFDESMDWEATIDMANDNVDGNIVGIKEGDEDQATKDDWDAAGLFAQSLGDQRQPFNDEQPEQINMKEMDMEDLAAAAREAVAKFEQQSVDEEDSDDEDFSDLMMDDELTADEIAAAARLSGDMYNKGAGTEDSDDGDELVLDDELNQDDVAAAARMAVDMFGNMGDAEGSEDGEFDDIFFDDDYSESAPPQRQSSPAASVSAPTQDWSKLTVVKLKDELKSRGLPTTGKKADLVAMLEEADKESMAGDSEEDDSEDEYLSELTSKELEDMAKAAREAVDLFGGDEPSDEILMQLENEGLDLEDAGDDSDVETEGDKSAIDYESMTVAELKDELRNRGLKISGKKAELIERLQS